MNNYGRVGHKVNDEIAIYACRCVYKMRYQPAMKMKVIFATELAGKDDEFVQAVRELTFEKLKSVGAL